MYEQTIISLPRAKRKRRQCYLRKIVSEETVRIRIAGSRSSPVYGKPQTFRTLECGHRVVVTNRQRVKERRRGPAKGVHCEQCPKEEK